MRCVFFVPIFTARRVRKGFILSMKPSTYQSVGSSGICNKPQPDWRFEVPYQTASELFGQLTGLSLSDHIAHEVVDALGDGLSVLDVSPSPEAIAQKIAFVAKEKVWRPIMVLAIDGADVPTRPEKAKGRRPVASTNGRSGTLGRPMAGSQRLSLLPGGPGPDRASAKLASSADRPRIGTGVEASQTGRLDPTIQGSTLCG